MSTAPACFLPLHPATAKPLQLDMQRLWLTGRLLPAGARLTVQHTFRCGETKPIEVIYSFPLPRDAALRRFRITGDGFEAWSELKPREEATRIYEEGLAQGSLSTLARQYGDGVVNLTVGNVRPAETVTVHLEILAGVELRDDGYRFRFPFTLAPGYHSKARCAVTAGQGEMELPAAEFGDVILPRFPKDASSLHEVGFELQLIHELAVAEIGSPSHAVRVQNEPKGPARVSLAPERDIPDRDLILDVRFSETKPQVLSGSAGDGRNHFAAIVPSPAFGSNPETPRRIAILLDRSGSMQGAPIAQAKKAIEACLAALTEHDSFALIAFDDRIESLHPTLLTGTRENRGRASAFLKGIDARGGTELAAGVQEAARLVDGGGDILILTDGQVFGAETILEKARSANLRLSCLGIGSASQDRFLSLLARETGGIGRFVTPRERVDLAAVDLFASIGRPVASDLKVSGAVQPEPPAAVFAGTPVLLFGEASHEPVKLAWDGGGLELPIPPGDPATGETVRLLQGSRLITDWESRYPAEEATAPLERRKQSRVAARLAALSAEYGLASREMSLVAVVKRAGDRPGELPETRVVPVGMPQDTPFDAYFQAAAPIFAAAAPPPPSEPMTAMFSMARAMPLPRESQRFARKAVFSRTASTPPPAAPEDHLMVLAAQLEPDGGMPGANESDRAARTAAAILAFVAAGNTLTSGPFRSHLARLVGYLRQARLAGDEPQLARRVIEIAAHGAAPSADWLKLTATARWPDLAAELLP